MSLKSGDRESSLCFATYFRHDVRHRFVDLVSERSVGMFLHTACLLRDLTSRTFCVRALPSIYGDHRSMATVDLGRSLENMCYCVYDIDRHDTRNSNTNSDYDEYMT